MTLREITKNVQRMLPGVEVDGVVGSQTMLAVFHHLQASSGIVPVEIPEEQLVVTHGRNTAIHARTLKTIATLDPKARDNFIRFAQLAEATAATFGCDYIAISGYRTWEEQAILKKKSDAGGAHAAAPGYSWHNFAMATDWGVFLNNGTIYLDSGTKAQQALAEKVHYAVAMHAAACGLVHGGTWKGKSCDPPHYQIDMGRSSPNAADRAKFKAEGSLL